MSLLENAEVISLTDAASASDALDDELARRLGPAPEPTTAERPRAGGTRGPQRKARAESGRQAPSAAELVKPLEGSLGLLTLGAGLLICGFNLEDPLVNHVTMDAAEAEAVARPLANILARQKWFTQYGRQFLNSEDYIALTFALMVYAGRVVPPVRARLAERAPRERRAQQAARVSAGPANNPASNGSANGYASGGPFGLSGAYAVTD